MLVTVSPFPNFKRGNTLRRNSLSDRETGEKESRLHNPIGGQRNFIRHWPLFLFFELECIAKMSNRVSSKYKLDRRMGENIWGRPKSPVNRREYGPGQHGQRRKGKLSDFGTQLRAKQKLKGYYGSISEKQFLATYKEASRIKGNTAENLIGLLERRLDAVVYRAKLVPTVFAARQFVNHGHVLVNGKRVNVPSYRVQIDDVVEVRQKSREMGLVLEAIQSPERDVPDYIDADHKKLTAKLVRIPLLADVPYPVMMEPNLVIEFYSS